MKKLFPATATTRLIIVAIALTVFPYVALAQDKVAKIQELLSLAHKYRQFNGSALVAENGKIIFKQGYGMANMEWEIPNAPDTKFRLGSITKQFTSMLTLQLVEQGKLKLDAKISDYLPEYRKDIGGKVTIHHLLTHTSGIPSYTGLPKFFEDVSRNPFKVTDFVTRYTSGDLEFEPGTKYAYNNSGYFLLGAIIEKVTGKSYEQVLKENIFDPLGMKNTGYDHHSTLLPKRAGGYSKTPDGYTNANYLDMSIPYAAGSLYSTVEDLFIWDQALYTDKLITAQSRELMYKPFLQNYAYGWSVNNAALTVDGQPVQSITHGGGINGFSTTIMRYPKDRHLIVILDNTENPMGRLGTAIAKILYNQPYDSPKMSIATQLEKTIKEKGVQAAIAEYRELKTKQSPIYDFGEPELGQLSSRLTAAGKVKEAIEILKLNTEVYPQGFRSYDLLGRAYMSLNETELAKQSFKKSLELNPNNTNATDMLKRIDQPPVRVDAKVFDSYVGEYELAPGFVLRVFREGDKFLTQATGQGVNEIVAESETTFAARTFAAKLMFVKDAEGKVTGVKLMQGGRETLGKKIK
jgi:CubicO group peptidase (beta-lactamase class C family)